MRWRWPWMPPPDVPDPELATRMLQAHARWREAADDLRGALLAADEYVKAEQEEEHGGA